MHRRSFLAGAGGALLAGSALGDALPVPPSEAIGFKVLRNGTPIGEHHLTFTQTGNELAVEIAVALDVYIAGIRFFHYTLAATERWSGGVFQSLDSKINNNGTQLEVHAHKIATGYDVIGINHTHPEKSYPEYTTPPNTMPLTYWNKAMLNGTILNIQTAHSYPAIVSSPGWNKLPTANGGFIIAQRYDVTGKLHLTVWYDQSNQWSGLQFQINGTESYEKIT